MSASTFAELRCERLPSRRLRIWLGDAPPRDLPWLWLLDNDPAFRHPQTGQRLRELRALPAEPELVAARVDGDQLRLSWAGGLPETALSLAWLAAHAPPQVPAEDRRLWGAELQASLPGQPWEALETPAGQRAILEDLHRLGFARLVGGPTTPGAVLAVAERFGHVRATNYGRLFDVVSKPDPEHLAYTGAALAVHTDNPYRDKVPGVQLLHCLRARSDAGGESVLVDGFAAVAALGAADPAALEALESLAVPFRYRDAEVDLRWSRPLIERDRHGRPQAVAFNDRSLAPLDLPCADIERFYAAYRAFAAQVHAPERAVRFLLAPGDLIVFDNQRILHGRDGFTQDPGARHLQGCYADRDAFDSLRRVLARP